MLPHPISLFWVDERVKDHRFTILGDHLEVLVGETASNYLWSSTLRQSKIELFVMIVDLRVLHKVLHPPVHVLY